MVFSAVDRASRTMRRIMASERRMAAATQSNAARSERATGRTERALSRTERTMASLSRAARRSFDAVVNGARRAGRAVRSLHDRTVQLGQLGIGQIGQGWSRARGGLLAGAAAVTIAYGGAAAAANGLVGTASEFERFQTILVTTEGSAEAAQAAMGWVQNFAVSTPYELDQVTDAFVQLRAYGLDPTHGLLQTLGDTSAAMGRPLGQAVEAMADAVMGQNERLLEYGIRASTVGDQITYSYTNAAGEAMTATAAATDRMAIQQTLMGIMNERYSGSMERLSQTWDGMVSNVLDLWSKFQMMIMDAGLFDWMKGKLRQILDTINLMEADGTLQEWAVQIGQTIQTALSNIWEFGRGVWEIIQQVSGYLSVAADYVGGWKNLSMILAGIAFAPTLISTAAGLVQIASGLAALSTALLANPIILAIALIAGGVYLIYRNWDAIGPYFRALWDGVKATVSTVWEWLKTAFAWTPLGMIINNWGAISEALSGPLEAGRAAIDVVWSAVRSLFDWNPSETITSAWAGVSAALASPVETGRALASAAWDGIKTLFSWTPLGLIISNWSSISAALSNPLETGRAAIEVIWYGFETLFAWSPLGLIVSNWSTITGALSGPIEAARSAVDAAWNALTAICDWNPVTLISTLWSGIPSAISSAINSGRAMISSAWDQVKAIFSADWLPNIDTTTLVAAINTMTGIVQSGWDTLSGIFDSIVAGAAALGDAVGSAIQMAISGAEAALDAISGSRGVERIFDQLENVAGRGAFSADFVQGLALTEALSAGEVSLEAYRQSLEAVVAEGGTFAQTAREMIEASRQLDDFRMPEPPVPTLPPTAEIEGALAKLAEIETASARVPEIVRGAMTSIDSILANTNFTDRGVALMRTLAEGIRAGTHLVVAATAAATQQVRDHLPSSPAKTGPLSDIHRLKFGETIASSIRAAPMVAAMRGAASATMAAALPISQSMAVAATAVPEVAARSVLPEAREARTAQAPSSIARAGGAGSGEGGRTISVSYGDFHFDSASPENLRHFSDEMARHRRELKRLVDREDARERRKDF